MPNPRNSTERVLLADVGGTNVRFAVLTGDVPSPIVHLAVNDYERFMDALAAFMAKQDAAIHGAILGVAGVVEGDRCALTNSRWVVDAAELRARFGFARVRLINDFEPIAWALPQLAADDLRQVGGRDLVPGAPMAVLGPGTGLGVAVYVPRKQGGFVMRSEGGHATAPSGSPREDAVIEILRKKFGHVSAERILSGHGLENLYSAIASVDAVVVPARSSVEITQAALVGSCAISRTALDMFCAMLGEVAGNFALSFSAQGGVFLAGGIISHIRDYLPRSQFRARFDAKGRMGRYVEVIPAYLILHDDPAFIGLRSLAARQMQAG